MAARYTEALSGVECCRPLDVPVGSVSNFYKYVALLAPHVDRSELKRTLAERAGISLSGEVYAVPLHRQPVLAGSGGEFPVADDVCARHICLPVHSDMTDSEVEYVVENLISALDKRAAS